MSATYEELIGFVRIKCGDPPISVVSDGKVDLLLTGQIDYLTTEFSLSKNLWVSGRKPLTVNAGDDFILVSGQDSEFGKPYSVETMDSGDPNHRVRRIAIVDPAELVRSYHGGDPGPSDVKHSAEAIAFFVEGADWRARLGPKPGTFAEYLILYEPPTQRPKELDSRGFPFEQFEDYLTWRGAKAVLPYAKRWFKAEDQLEEYEDIRVEIASQVEQGDFQFAKWRRTNRNGNNFKARPFGYRRRFRRRTE